MNEVIGIIIAAILCWLNFVIVDTYFGLPEQPGVRGARIIGKDVEKRGGDIAGGFFQGNILCSPDALLGIPGGIIAAFLVFIGNRLCADPGYAGTTGCLTATAIIFLASFIGLTPEMFIVGMVIAIFTVMGIDQAKMSVVLGKIAKKFNRHARE